VLERIVGLRRTRTLEHDTSISHCVACCRPEITVHKQDGAKRVESALEHFYGVA
jgi:hypothetical protein